MNVWAFQTMLDSVVNYSFIVSRAGGVDKPDLIPNGNRLFELNVVESATTRLTFYPEYPSIELGRDGNLLATVEFDQLVLMEASPLCKWNSAVTDEKLANIYKSRGRDKVGHYFIF